MQALICAHNLNPPPPAQKHSVLACILSTVDRISLHISHRHLEPGCHCRSASQT